jgi:hypothetical protein
MVFDGLRSDGLVRGALEAFTEDFTHARWWGKEHDCVNRSVHGCVTPQGLASGVLAHPTQVAIEGLAQPHRCPAFAVCLSPFFALARRRRGTAVLLGMALVGLSSCATPTELRDEEPRSVAGTWVGTFALPHLGVTFEVEFRLLDEASDRFSGTGSFTWSVAGGGERTAGSGVWLVTIVGERGRPGQDLLWESLSGERHRFTRDWDLWLRWTEIRDDDTPHQFQSVIGGGAPASGNFGELRGAGSPNTIALQSVMAADINPALPPIVCGDERQCYELLLTRR